MAGVHSPLKAMGWGAIAKLLQLVDSFLLSTNEKPLRFTVLDKLSVMYHMDKKYLKAIFISTAMLCWRRCYTHLRHHWRHPHH